MSAGSDNPEVVKQRPGRLLRYSEDMRTLFFAGAYFAATAAAWRVDWSQRSWAEVCCTCGLLTLMAFQGCVTVHNCAHCPPFVSSTLNSWWFLVISVWNGASATAYIPGHNLGHHKYLQSRQDVIRTSKVDHSYQLFNLLSYFPRIYPAIYKNDMAYFEAQRELGRPVYEQFRMDTAAVLTFYAVLGVLNFKSFFWIVLIPQVVGKDMIVTLNLLQHDGCDPEHDVNHSRNFTGPILNYFVFNNGYHAIHHMMPGKHWSQLKRLHDTKVAPVNHPSLDHPNILRYLFVTFVLPTPRTNYDGTPYVNPGIHGELGPDKPWHYSQDSLNATGSDPRQQREVSGFGEARDQGEAPALFGKGDASGHGAKAKAA
mmetsp:Transcript_28873/g.84645  ORF Transcript_28873/g.84645 Transcript_28873/m.84645 type:complete len:370 (-) Transcript_28873:103-1212(-)